MIKANLIRVKDKDKIESVKKVCIENGLKMSILEDAKETKTRIVIDIPYKREVLIK